MTNFDWTPERKEEALRLATEGRSRSEIAAYFGITRNSVCGILKRLGHKHVGLWTEERIALAIRLIEVERMTSTQVGERLGCSGRAVIGALHRAGHKRDKPAPKPKRNGKRVFKFNEVVKNKPEASQPQIISKRCFIADDRETVAIWNLRASQCKWPFDPVEDGDLVTYCGKATGDIEKSFCVAHSQMAYRPKEGKSKDEKVQSVRGGKIARSLQFGDF